MKIRYSKKKFVVTLLYYFLYPYFTLRNYN